MHAARDIRTDCPTNSRYPIEVKIWLVPPQGIEPGTDAYKATVIPFNYRGNSVTLLQLVMPVYSTEMW